MVVNVRVRDVCVLLVLLFLRVLSVVGQSPSYIDVKLETDQNQLNRILVLCFWTCGPIKSWGVRWRAPRADWFNQTWSYSLIVSFALIYGYEF